jgi:hypothetical protein
LVLVLVPLTGSVRGEQGPARERTEARGWLQLEQDQRTYRDRAAPPTPGDPNALRGIEQRQRLELRQLQVRQEREGRMERRREAPREGYDPSPAGRTGRDQRDRDRLRLDMRLQRENLGR